MIDFVLFWSVFIFRDVNEFFLCIFFKGILNRITINASINISYKSRASLMPGTRVENK